MIIKVDVKQICKGVPRISYSFCCEEMKKAFGIHIWQHKLDDDNKLYITDHNKQIFNECKDDMTIRYCPFCGAEIVYE